MCAQVRPGTVATYVLGLIGLAAFCGGGLASVLLLAMWSISRRHADTGVVDKSRQYDEVSSETGWSEVSTGLAPPKRGSSGTCLQRAPVVEHVAPCYLLLTITQTS